MTCQTAGLLNNFIPKLRIDINPCSTPSGIQVIIINGENEIDRNDTFTTPGVIRGLHDIFGNVTINVFVESTSANMIEIAVSFTLCCT